jgi:hypothetical protein
MLETAIAHAIDANRELFENGFVAGGRASLDRIAQYYRALAGIDDFPVVQCNAPWVSAVMEPGDVLRPCFFQPVYGSASEGLARALNSDDAMAFRRQLDVATNETCRRCVCSLNLPLTSRV